ncbi:bifunctional DNA-binding transcriptional regulator/O6-methylguanine-DNA methyltransferase Ada [Methylocella sp.]|uniref:bifunctional DNA-binding transcriptional regulator/O6-methylguanine-DNA methyltransferase Ada n=1 Tax=Methylocella sp. TaxID=1978226 RepID=UPI00378396A1
MSQMGGPRADFDPRWPSIVARDRAADGAFVYSVKTTGVYCRPSCPSRRANPENVAFHPTCEAAEAAGFRPCRRCRPNGAGDAAERAALVEKACRIIEQAEQAPSLEELAQMCAVSPSHFHRLFRAETGVTPKAYASAERARRVRRALSDGDASVTAAIYDAGFGSNGRFYETASKRLGMRPMAFKAGGAGAEIRFAVAECSLGSILVAQSAKGICAITLGDDPDALARELQDRFPRAELIGGDAAFERVVAQVVGFVERPSMGLALPLDIRGTAFQQRVWKALVELAPGTTASYADIARAIGAPRACRAVARACGANGIAVAIPCHRVVRNDGALSGYRWGVERKRALLERERGE